LKPRTTSLKELGRVRYKNNKLSEIKKACGIDGMPNASGTFQEYHWST
jgi:hypothetical protein